MRVFSDSAKYNYQKFNFQLLKEQRIFEPYITSIWGIR
jgi:hypothetical protein